MLLSLRVPLHLYTMEQLLLMPVHNCRPTFQVTKGPTTIPQLRACSGTPGSVWEVTGSRGHVHRVLQSCPWSSPKAQHSMETLGTRLRGQSTRKGLCSHTALTSRSTLSTLSARSWPTKTPLSQPEMALLCPNTSPATRRGNGRSSSAKQQSPAWSTALWPLKKHLQSTKSLKCQARSEVSHLSLTQGRFFLLLAASTARNSFHSDRVTGREVSFPTFPWKFVWEGFSSRDLRLRKGGFGGGWKTEAEEKVKSEMELWAEVTGRGVRSQLVNLLCQALHPTSPLKHLTKSLLVLLFCSLAA